MNRPEASGAELTDDDYTTISSRVEATVESGIPSFSAEGLGRSSRETRDRVRAAMLSSNLAWPMGKITVNVSNPPPRTADLDLEIALGLLKASGQLPDVDTDGLMGELGLDGSIRGAATTDAPNLRALVDSLKAGGSEVSGDPMPTDLERCRSLGSYAVAIGHLLDELGDDVPPRVTEAIRDAEELFDGILDELQAAKGAFKQGRADDTPAETAPTVLAAGPATGPEPAPATGTARTAEAERSWRLFRDSYGGWLDQYRKSLVIGGKNETERKLREAAGLAGVGSDQLWADKSRAYRGETSEQILEGR